jgi:site-specific recombinase XerD
VPLKYWDVKRGRVKSPHLYRPGAAINNVLDRIEKACDAFKTEGMAAGGWDFSALRKELDRITLRTSEPERPSVAAFIRATIEKRKATMRPNTIKAYNTTLRHLEGWEELHGVRLDFKDVDMDFFYSFTQYITAMGMNANSVGKDIKKLKTFLSEAEQAGHPLPSDYRTRRFSVKGTPSTHIYLTEEDLSAIAALSLDDRLDRVRDMFIVACRTGLRWSDWGKIRLGNIRQVDGVRMLVVKTEKTGQDVAIPIHPDVTRSLEKHGGQIHLLSMQKFNLWVKELAGLAGVRRPDMVSSHTARRTFATLLFRAGVPLMSIAKMTGHGSERVLLAYIKATIEENAVQVAKNRFFGE